MKSEEQLFEEFDKDLVVGLVVLFLLPWILQLVEVVRTTGITLLAVAFLLIIGFIITVFLVGFLTRRLYRYVKKLIGW